ncbi:MAG: ArsR/SmtB family transcription factor, partial [Methanosarcinales archaeon]
DMFVCELTYALDISQSAISHQLQILKNLDLVRANKYGRYTIYSIADDHVKHLINQCTEHVTENY